jgi:hypothetical protein
VRDENKKTRKQHFCTLQGVAIDFLKLNLQCLCSKSGPEILERVACIIGYVARSIIYSEEDVISPNRHVGGNLNSVNRQNFDSNLLDLRSSKRPRETAVNTNHTNK